MQKYEKFNGYILKTPQHKFVKQASFTYTFYIFKKISVHKIFSGWGWGGVGGGIVLLAMVYCFCYTVLRITITLVKHSICVEWVKKTAFLSMCTRDDCLLYQMKKPTVTKLGDVEPGKSHRQKHFLIYWFLYGILGIDE